MNQKDRENLARILSERVSVYETYPGAFMIVTDAGKVTVSDVYRSSSLSVGYCDAPADATSRLTTCYCRTNDPAYTPLRRLYDLSRERWAKDEAELNALLKLLK